MKVTCCGEKLQQEKVCGMRSPFARRLERMIRPGFANELVGNQKKSIGDSA